MPSCETLPEGVWKLILQLLPVRERLGVCASVSKTLHRAAVAATDRLILNLDRFSSDKTERLWQWLEQNGQYVTKLVVSGAHTTPHCTMLSPLPCQNLCQLQLSQCSVQLGPSSSHPGVLLVCTALTQLVLKDYRLTGGRTSLAALSAVPALQHLRLLSLQHDDSRVGPGPAYELPAAVLSCLQQLTSLELWGTGVCIRHISCLRKLQQLNLLNTAGLTPSNTPGLDQLTALQDLELSVLTLDPTVLQGHTTLRRLSLALIKTTSSTEGTQSLLALIAGQQQLQQLCLQGFHHDWQSAPSAYTALSASSKMQQLKLSDCTLPAVAWQQGVFRPGQQLPELQDFQFYFNQYSEAVPAAFSQQDVGALVSCCPALRTINIRIQPGVQLTGLTQLTALSSLSIIKADATSCSSLSALSNLRTLCTLTITGDTITSASLTPLSALRGLTRLVATGVEVSTEAVVLYNRGPVSKPDVWQQLLRRCQVQQQQQQQQQ